jgi:urease accessory protein
LSAPGSPAAAGVPAALLTLADSRLPAGGHAHSGGAEEACALGIVHDEPSLEAFLARRLSTAGRVAASLAAAGCRAAPSPDALATLDREAEARVLAPALRGASRAQGRGLVRVGRLAWPHPVWDALPAAPHHPLALGVAAYAGGLTPRDAATAAAYLAVTGPATAAQRLLGMDPMKVAAATARLAAAVDAEAARAAAGTGVPAACADPLLDLLAERHATRRERYFAS